MIMRKIYKLLIFVAIAVFALSLTACGKESKKDNSSDIEKDNSSAVWIKPEGLPTETESEDGKKNETTVDVNTFLPDKDTGDREENKDNNKSSNVSSNNSSTNSAVNSSSTASSTTSSPDDKEEPDSSKLVTSKDSDTASWSTGWIN